MSTHAHEPDEVVESRGRRHGDGFWSKLFGASRRGRREYRAWEALARQLLAAGASESGPRSILLVSPTASAAAATTALHLGGAFAEEHRRATLLADADPDGRLSRRLGVKHGRGLLDLLEDGPPGDLGNEAQQLGGDGLLVLPSGDPRPGISGLFVRERTGPLLAAAARAGRDLILVGAPLDDSSTALGFAPIVDSVVLVIDEGRTRVGELDRARDLLKAKARRLGIFLAAGAR